MSSGALGTIYGLKRSRTQFMNSAVQHKEYDFCVITAAGEHQAHGYREQIKWRMNRGRFPEGTEFLVFADPQGKRIGSGGSTIYILYRLLESFCRDEMYRSVEEAFKGKRILVLHSGGDSRRLPAYAAVGKVFTPLPIGSHADGFATLFDVFFSNLMQLPSLDHGQVVVASGDVLLSFDASEVIYSNSGVTGLAYPGPVEVASNHGVYVASTNNLGENPREVSDFLQKPSYDELKGHSGLDTAGRAFIDTGVVNFSLDAINVLMQASGISLEDGKVIMGKGSLCEDLINANIQLDIYEEFPFAMLGKHTDSDSNAESKMRSRISRLDLLNQIPFSVCILPYCEFFHVGRSKQLLQNFHAVNYTASAYGFQNGSRSRVMDKTNLEHAFAYNSLIDTDSMEVGGPAFIEGCHLDGTVSLEGENILTGVPKGAGDIELQKGICITCVPVSRVEDAAGPEEGWVSLVYGIEDGFKKLAEDNAATFLNRPFVNWMDDAGISPVDLWADNETHELWYARLFPFSKKPAESLQIFQGEFQLDSWRQSYRMSLKQVLQAVDYERLLGHYSNLCRKVNLENLTLNDDLSSDEILSWCREEEDYVTAVENTLAVIEKVSSNVLAQARLYKLLSNILRQASDLGYSEMAPRIQDLASSVEYEDKAFELVREAIGKGLRIDPGLKTQDSSQEILPSVYPVPPDNLTNLRIQIRSDEVVWACAPARLDFAGGWSDTPPYCLEHGGSVLNAAVKLNRQYPIQAIGRIHTEPFIKINSIDLGQHAIISEISEMLSYQDPADWSALPKAAFIVTGIIPGKADLWAKPISPPYKGGRGDFLSDMEMRLEHILEQLGGGIDLTLFSAVPSGSGLGTSSILGSAIIACLSRMLGQELTHEELFNRTLYMEQLMTTGGGWQDQIGGVVGGVKHIQTEPGLFQIPRISWTDLRSRPDMDLSERFLLYYTGYRRMAKGILRNIVGKYLDRYVTTLQTINRLRDVSFEMKEELDHRNIDAFGKKIAEVWELNKTLDPGTSNEDIEGILNRISHLIHGAKLLGAGGGGFLFIVTKGVEQSRKVKEILGKSPPNNRARFFDFDIDQEGLKVSVL